MISDRAAADIARSLLQPFIDLGIVSDKSLANAVEIVKLRVEQDDNEKVIESAEASLAVSQMLTAAIKDLPT